MLHGIPADVRGGRVLESGCAAGRNLIPQAAEFPGSQFVGAIFRHPVAAGGSAIAELSLDNIELRQAGIAQVDTSWGQFDYILCLGVFSWVTADLQAKLLSICRENLAPHGVALISFNAYPGWHPQTVGAGPAAISRGRLFGPPPADLRGGRCWSSSPSNPREDGSRPRVSTSTRFLRTARDEYLFHEYLVDDNHPPYLHPFVGQAEAVGPAVRQGRGVVEDERHIHADGGPAGTRQHAAGTNAANCWISSATRHSIKLCSATNPSPCGETGIWTPLTRFIWCWRRSPNRLRSTSPMAGR